MLKIKRGSMIVMKVWVRMTYIHCKM